MSVRRTPMHDCPSCTCGLVTLSWSDRQTWVWPDDVAKIADVVASCALDHHYDRTGDDGVPWGDALTDAERELLIPVVAHHLGAIDPGWQDRTVNATAPQREALRAELEATLRSARAAGSSEVAATAEERAR